MRKAYFGYVSILFLGINGLLTIFHFAGLFPYFFTLFYPLFCLLPFLMAMLGFFERDEIKWPSVLAGVAAVLMLIHWIIVVLVPTFS